MGIAEDEIDAAADLLHNEIEETYKTKGKIPKRLELVNFAREIFGIELSDAIGCEIRMQKKYSASLLRMGYWVIPGNRQDYLNSE
jgi:hypothetical protein